MEQLRRALESNGFALPSIQLDGKIHRFNRNGNDNAWFIGFQNHGIKDGKVYVVAQYGDWKTGEKFDYKPAGMSKIDLEACKAQIEQAKLRVAQEKLHKQHEAAAKAEKQWKSAGEAGTTPYMARKKIDQCYGIKIYQDTMQVPLRDSDGKLWGLQYIFGDGKKRFSSGAKVDGCFHTIRQDGAVDRSIDNYESEIFLCEGFATGVSIHKATGKTVVVSFTAHNLGQVAKSIKQKYPDVAITICGDDDRFHPEEIGNPGRDKAEQAGMITQSSVVFPIFASDEGKPTDFNDLEIVEGLDVVKNQLTTSQDPATGFLPLGYEEGTYFFFHLPSKDVVKVTTWSKPQLYALAPDEYWFAKYPGKTGADFNKATDDLIQISRKIGPFDSSRIRGCGVWYDHGRVVVNTGRELIVDDKKVSLADFRSHYIYVQTRNRLSIHEKPLSVKETLLLTNACDALAWRDPKSPYLLAGWIAIARIAGALPIHPHFWLTGGSGTGKSTVMEHLIAPCLGNPASKIHIHGCSTEAGIRQRIRSSSVPVIFDEFETTDEYSKNRINALVELLRVAWSESQGAVIKGSNSGLSVEYQLAFSALVSSVRVNLTNDADRNRFSVCELAPHQSDAGSWQYLQRILNDITEEYGERLFARMILNVRNVRESQRIIAKELAATISQRFGQQVGMILAGYWCLTHDEVITPELAKNMIAELDLNDEKLESKITDEEECLTYLLTYRFHLRTSSGDAMEKTIMEINRMSDDGLIRSLKTYGIILTYDGIVVANSHAELAKIFKPTRWTNWSQTLKRCFGAEFITPRKFNEVSSRAIRIPLTQNLGSGK